MTIDAAPKPRKRRGKAAKIDPERVRHLVDEGMTVADLADLYEVSRNAIVGICQDYGIGLHAGRPRREKVEAKPKQPEVTEPNPDPSLTPKMAALAATRGRYAELRAWAQQWGVTETKAQQEWHKLRPTLPRRLR